MWGGGSKVLSSLLLEVVCRHHCCFLQKRKQSNVRRWQHVASGSSCSSSTKNNNQMWGGGNKALSLLLLEAVPCHHCLKERKQSNVSRWRQSIFVIITSGSGSSSMKNNQCDEVGGGKLPWWQLGEKSTCSVERKNKSMWEVASSIFVLASRKISICDDDKWRKNNQLEEVVGFSIVCSIIHRHRPQHCLRALSAASSVASKKRPAAVENNQRKMDGSTRYQVASNTHKVQVPGTSKAY